MEPVYGIFLSTISSPPRKPLWMRFDPLKRIDGLLKLFRSDHALKDVILKKVVWWIVRFL